MISPSAMTFSLAWHPELYRVEEYPAIVAACGVKALNWVGCYGKSPAVLRRLTLDAGLEVSCHTFVLQSFSRGLGEDAACSEAEARFAEAVELGAPRVMIVPLPIDGVETRAECRKRWCSLLARLAAPARAAHCQLTVENFEGAASPFVTAADLLEILDAAPEVRFTFDAGNAATGEDPVDCARLLSGKIEYVHLKDWQVVQAEGRGTIRGIDGRLYRNAPVGEGENTLSAVVRELARQKYCGYADIEYGGTDFLPDEVIRRGVAWLKAAQEG